MFVLFGATGFIGRALQSILIARRTPYIGFGSETCIRSDGATASRTAVSTAADRAKIMRRSPAPAAVIFAAGTAVTGTAHEVLEKSHLGSLRDAFESIPTSWRNELLFVYTSSSVVYERSTALQPLLETASVVASTPYATVKLQCEGFVRETIAATGVRTVVARLFNVSGFGHRVGIVAETGQQAIEIQSGDRSEFQLRSNEPVFDLIDVGDAATALLILAEAPRAPPLVNVCSGRPVTTEDLIASARRTIGRDAPVKYANPTERRLMLVGSPDLMNETTGWRARRSLDEIVAAVISGQRSIEDRA